MIQKRSNSSSVREKRNDQQEKIWLDDSIFPSNLELFRERLFFSGKLKSGLEYFVLFNTTTIK